MATRLYGVLLDGLKKPIVNATVVLLAKGNTITVLNGSEAIFKTDAQGAYNVTVQSGYYKVIIGPQGIEPYKAGEIAIYADSPEGSLNSYLVNWAEEDLTPEVIKQVKELVAISEQYSLQAGRSAAAAQADATDARNSKASAAQSASDALTYKNDSKANADAAKQAQAGAAGSANTANAAVTTIQGIQKEVNAAKDRAITAETNAKASQESSATSAAASANSAGASKTSQDAAKASELKAKEYVDTINPEQFLVKTRDLDDVSNKKLARRNLQVYHQATTNLDDKHLDELTGEFEGFYFQNLTAKATPQKGYPVTAAGSLMVVKNYANGEAACHQIYRPHNTQLYYFCRWYNPSTKIWSTWIAYYAQEATDAYRTRIGLGTGNNPQFSNLNLVVNNDNPSAATGVISGYLNNTSGQKRLGYRLYGEIRGDNKEWITLHVSNADSSINKYAGFNIEGNFVIPGTFKGTAIEVSDVELTKSNIGIDRFIQGNLNGETRMVSKDKTKSLHVFDTGVWGCWDISKDEVIPLGVSYGGTGGKTDTEARISLKISDNDDVKFSSITSKARKTGPIAYLAEALGYTAASTFKSVMKNEEGNETLAIAEFRSDTNGAFSLINRDPSGGSDSFFYVFRRDGYAEFPALNVKATAARPLLLDTANPTIEFKDTDTGSRFFIVADGVSFRANVDSTGGGRVWEYNKTSGQITLAKLTDVNVENSAYSGVTIRTTGTSIVGAINRFEVTPAGSFYLVVRPQEGTTGQRVINFPTAAGTLALQGTSDINYKENINSYDGLQSVENIRKMELVTFNFKDDDKKRLRRGVIAQQIEEIDETYVKHTFEECGEDILDEDGNKVGNTNTRERIVLDSNVLILDLICSMKVMINESDKYKERITQLETEVTELKKLVATLVNKESLP